MTDVNQIPSEEVSEEVKKELDKAMEEGFEEGDAAPKPQTTPDPDSKPAPEPTPEPAQKVEPASKEPEPASKKTPDPDPDPDPDPKPDPDPDPKPEITLADIATQMSSMQEQTHDWQRRMGGRIGVIEEKSKQQQSLVQDPAPSKKQISEAMLDGEKFKELGDEFPLWKDSQIEVIKLVEERLADAPDAAALKELEDKLTTLVSTTAVSSESTAMSVREFVKVDNAFPELDWEAELDSPAFGKWFSGQAKEVKDLAGSDRAADAITVIKKYHEYQKASAKKIEDKQRLESSIDPVTPGSKPAVVTQTLDDEFEAGFKEG